MTTGQGRIAKAGAAVAVVAALAAYAGPKLVALNGVPRRIDASVGAADRYNHGLEQLGRLEGATLTNLEPLARIRASLDGVLVALGATGGDLASAANRVQHDLTAALDPTVPALARLSASLDDLEARTRALGAPLASSAVAIGQAREALAQVQADTSAVAGALHDARTATDGAAKNVVGAAR